MDDPTYVRDIIMLGLFNVAVWTIVMVKANRDFWSKGDKYEPQ